MNHEDDEPRDPADLLPFTINIEIKPGEVIPQMLNYNDIPTFGKLRPKKSKRRSVVYTEE